eukprot:6181426-Pleurochrysis_carterae.AAC.1
MASSALPASVLAAEVVGGSVLAVLACRSLCVCEHRVVVVHAGSGEEKREGKGGGGQVGG